MTEELETLSKNRSCPMVDAKDTRKEFVKA